MANIRGPYEGPSRGETLMTEYGFDVDTLELGMAEKGRMLAVRATRDRLPVGILVATEAVVSDGGVARYRGSNGRRPIDVVEKGGTYYVIDGHHRAAAAAADGAREIPALVRRWPPITGEI